MSIAALILSFNVWNDWNIWNDWNKRQQAGAFEGAKMAEEKLTTKVENRLYRLKSAGEPAPREL